MLGAPGRLATLTRCSFFSFKQPATPVVYPNGICTRFVNKVKEHSLLLCASLKDDTDTQKQVKSFHWATSKLRSTCSPCSTEVINTLMSCVYHADVYASLLCCWYTQLNGFALHSAYNHAYRHTLSHGAQGSIPIFLAYLVILWFENRLSKQKYCCSPKSNILAPQNILVPKILGWLRHCLSNFALDP